jgi:hypothetical protein
MLSTLTYGKPLFTATAQTAGLVGNTSLRRADAKKMKYVPLLLFAILHANWTESFKGNSTAITLTAMKAKMVILINS